MGPLISVLMTAYNREKYISEAIESVLCSTYANWELIITDDCSTDTTLDIARRYEARDSRIRVYKNEKNLGDYPNRNRAASYAKGDFLMSVDSDDTLFPYTMEKCIEMFSKFGKASFGIYKPNCNLKGTLLEPKEALYEHFFSSPYLMMGPGGSVIKTEYFHNIGGFPTKYGPANDRYYNLKAASASPTILIPFELIYYRRHEGQEMNNSYAYLYNNFLYLRDALKELDLYLNENELNYLLNKNRRRFVVNIAKFIINEKSYKRTLEAVKRAEFGVSDAFHGIFH